MPLDILQKGKRFFLNSKKSAAGQPFSDALSITNDAALYRIF